jgi:hypothetical protein
MSEDAEKTKRGATGATDGAGGQHVAFARAILKSWSVETNYGFSECCHHCKAEDQDYDDFQHAEACIVDQAREVVQHAAEGGGATDPGYRPTLDEFREVRWAADDVTLEEFGATLKAVHPHIGEEYARDKWPDWRADPAGWLGTRSSPAEREALWSLVLVALDKRRSAP